MIFTSSIRKFAVVDGIGHVVAARGGREVDLQDHVDDELLAGVALEVEDAVIAASREAGERDAVGHRRALVAAPRRRIASDLRRRTSCTRTPQTPASTASTVVASVAASRWSTGRGVPSGAASSAPR